MLKKSQTLSFPIKEELASGAERSFQHSGAALARMQVLFGGEMLAHKCCQGSVFMLWPALPIRDVLPQRTPPCSTLRLPSTGRLHPPRRQRDRERPMPPRASLQGPCVGRPKELPQAPGYSSGLELGLFPLFSVREENSFLCCSVLGKQSSSLQPWGLACFLFL